MKRTAIYGAGGLGREVRLYADDPVFVSDNPIDNVPGYAVLAPHQLTAEHHVVIAINDSIVRRRLAERHSHLTFGQLISPDSRIGENVALGEGAILCAFSMITADARIGRHFQANVYACVAHDCVVGDFVTLGPRATVNGNVHVDDGVYIGCGAIIRQGTPQQPLRIGAGATIGAGAVVLNDVPAGATVVGNPARVLIKREIQRV